MGNGQLIKDIKENFTDLLQHNRDVEVKPLINTIVRSLGRIKTDNKALNLSLLKIANDLKSAETSEEQFYRQQNPATKNIQYSKSFFLSLDILKEELFKILDELTAGK
ncbi:MAG: hypothetical protein ACXVNO_05910 [Bacteroidia bacterium]